MGAAADVLPGAHWLVWALAAVWYLRLGRVSLTLPAIAVLAVLVALAHLLGAASTGAWLTGAVGGFVVGWIFQALGHVWEVRKPAFFDDLSGLLVSPMFVVAEVLMAASLQPGLRERIEQAAGPLRPGCNRCRARSASM